MRYSALAECQGGKPKTVFTWNKWLSAVNAVNGFTECVNEYQRIFLWNKTLRLNGSAEVVQTRSETSIISSSHSQIWTLSVSEKNSKKHRNCQDFFLLYIFFKAQSAEIYRCASSLFPPSFFACAFYNCYENEIFEMVLSAPYLHLFFINKNLKNCPKILNLSNNF